MAWRSTLPPISRATRKTRRDGRRPPWRIQAPSSNSATSPIDRADFVDLAVAARRDPEQPHERAPHQVDAAEPGGRRHLLEAAVRPLEQTPRGFYARLQ